MLLVDCLGKDETARLARQCAEQIHKMLCTLENGEWSSLKEYNKKDFEIYNALSSDGRRKWCMKRDFQFACKCVMLDALELMLEELEKPTR